MLYAETGKYLLSIVVKSELCSGVHVEVVFMYAGSFKKDFICRGNIFNKTVYLS